MVYSDTSGNFRELLLTLLGEPNPAPPSKKPQKSVGGFGKQPRLVIQEVGSGTISRNMLDSNDVFIFDNGFEVFVWWFSPFFLLIFRVFLPFNLF